MKLKNERSKIIVLSKMDNTSWEEDIKSVVKAKGYRDANCNPDMLKYAKDRGEFGWSIMCKCSNSESILAEQIANYTIKYHEDEKRMNVLYNLVNQK